MPAPRHGHRVEAIEGGLLAFGGFGDPGLPDRGARETWWLAPGAGSWQRRADLGRGRAFFSSAVVDGSVYAVGDGVERYDVAADRWIEVVPPGALPVSHFAAAALGRTIFVLGGFPADCGGLHAVDLDVAGHAATVRDQPSPPGFKPSDHFHVVQALGGRLHVIGGLDVESFEPRREHWILGAGGFEAQAPPPSGIWAKFTVQAVVGDELYLFGDSGSWRFEAATGRWARRAAPGRTLVMAPSVAIDGTIWVVGGMEVGSDRSPLLAYDVAADAWRDAAPGSDEGPKLPDRPKEPP